MTPVPGAAFVARTFTPIDWDAAGGRTRIVGDAHGDGAGSAWVRGVEPGNDVSIATTLSQQFNQDAGAVKAADKGPVIITDRGHPA